MTLSSARAAAAQAIRDAATTAQVRRVLEVDVLHERQIPAIARGLIPAHIATSGDSGPADVAVMATGRRASQAIGITAVLIVLDRVDLDPELAGTGRGLAVHDVVAQALEGLPGSGLPRLFVESNVEQLPFAVQEAQGGGSKLRSSDPYVALHVYTINVEWPSAFPEAPLAIDLGSSTSAIRDHVSAAISAGLPTDAATGADAGATEERRRVAVQLGTVPRAWITLHTQRETIGGSPDFVARESMTWMDSESPPRKWSAQAVTQTVVVIIHVAHRTEVLADFAVLRIAAELEGSVVTWPGDFDARVFEGGVMVTQRLSGGDYEQDVRLIMFDRAEWDAEAGLGIARLQVGIEAADPIEPATQVVSPGVVEHAADPIVPVGTVRVAVGDTLEVGEIGHGLEGAVTATSDDTGIATVAVAGNVVTVTGVAAGIADVEIVETASSARRLLRVQVRR